MNVSLFIIYFLTDKNSASWQLHFFVVIVWDLVNVLLAIHHIWHNRVCALFVFCFLIMLHCIYRKKNWWDSEQLYDLTWRYCLYLHRANNFYLILLLKKAPKNTVSMPINIVCGIFPQMRHLYALNISVIMLVYVTKAKQHWSTYTCIYIIISNVLSLICISLILIS